MVARGRGVARGMATGSLSRRRLLRGVALLGTCTCYPYIGLGLLGDMVLLGVWPQGLSGPIGLLQALPVAMRGWLLGAWLRRPQGFSYREKGSLGSVALLGGVDKSRSPPKRSGWSPKPQHCRPAPQPRHREPTGSRQGRGGGRGHRGWTISVKNGGERVQRGAAGVAANGELPAVCRSQSALSGSSSYTRRASGLHWTA